jgi:hypothetical protein
MELIVLNTDFIAISTISVFKSLIWTDRYWECGDIEFCVDATKENKEKFQLGYYILSEESDHVMIIEDFKINIDVEDGMFFTITGSSLESLLKRRIIWSQTILSGKLQNAIKKLITENIISPSKTQRIISNFVFEDSDDEYITGLTVDAQFTGDNLYDAITSLCQNANIGFMVTLNELNQFVFKLYYGKDRTYNQTDNPFVIFSQSFGNLINSEYVETNSSYKNVALVAGEGEGSDRKTTVTGDDSKKDLDRYELYVDARDISSTINGGTLTTSEYNEQLIQRGDEKLAKCKTTKAFDGEVETTILYKYGENFYMGDIVQFESEFDFEARVRITEYIYSEDSEGLKYYPTFEVIDEDE